MTGQPFRRDVFGVSSTIYIEIAFGADLTASSGTWTWTDVTADVMHGASVQITQGRGDETSQAQPAGCSFTLLNTAGTYTPYNPLGSLYPNVKRNTPVRVRLDLGSGASTLFQGYANGFTPDWSADASGKLAVVKVSASGLLRRVTQGKTPLRSPLYRSIMSSLPMGYWPMEDGARSTQLASAISGVPSLSFISENYNDGTTDNLPNSVTYASKSGPAGLGTLPDFSHAAAFTVAIPSYAASTSWAVSAWFQLDQNPASGGAYVFSVTTAGTIATWYFDVGSNGFINLYRVRPDQTLTSSGSASAVVTDQLWHQAVLKVSQSGANIAITVIVDDVTVISATETTATVGNIGNVTVNPLGPGNSETIRLFSSIGHLTVWGTSPASTSQTAPGSGYTGETADTRIARICGEENVPVTVTGTSTRAMGPQPIAALIDIIRECEAADGGILYDGFDAGLRYRCLSNRYNLAAAFTVDASAGQLAPPHAPVDDDQRNRNDYTVSRTGGSSARYIDSTGPLGTGSNGIGTYDSSLTVNTSTDDPLDDIAAWNVHLGTVQGLRYPNMALDFVATSSIAQAWLNAPRISFRVDVLNVDNVVTQAPPDDISVIVEGYSQTLSVTSWTAAPNCSPYSPWQVGVADSFTGKADSSSSTLASSVAAGSVGASITLSVGTTLSGDLWTLDSTQWTAGQNGPLYVIYGGEIAQVTNITGASSPQSITVTRGTNGVAIAHASGTPVHVYQPALAAL